MNTVPLQLRARAELEIRRRQAERSVAPSAAASASLLAFTQRLHRGYLADPFHQLVATTLDGVVAGDIDRLMIFAPPQHGKSQLVSVNLPAYWLGKRPDDPVILASYGANLAERHSRSARNIVESSEYASIFPGVQTSRDSRAVDYWQLRSHYGGMLAVGIGGPITGSGGRLGLIDDPFENWEQAQSPTRRDTVWDWWQATFRTRVWEGGAIILICTRWHADDLAGRILQQQAHRWHVLRLPALAETQVERDENNRYLGLPVGEADPLGREPDESLSPRRFSREALEEIKRDVGSRAWAAEYQGVPRPAEGSRIKREWLSGDGKIVEVAPVIARRARYWDKAGTEGGGKYTAGVLIAVTGDGLIYVEDVVRGQWSAGNREAEILATAERDAAKWGYLVQVYTEQEPGSGGKESAEATIRSLAGYPIHADRPTGDKDTRLEPFAVQAEAGNVRLVRGSWNAAYIDELISLPGGAYRDQSDATAGAYNKIMGTPAATPAPSHPVAVVHRNTERTPQSAVRAMVAPVAKRRGQ